MSDRKTQTRFITGVALLGGGLATGVIIAAATGASAAGTSTASSASTTASATAPSNGETAVTGSKATALKAAALKQVPGGTVDSVTTETDHSGAAYEVHVTKSDGTRVSVLFDANLTYVTTDTNAGHRHSGGSGETTVTGANATTLKAAALKQVPGATVDEVTTDSGDAAYEVHLTKADGTEVTAKFDKNLAFVAVETGRGK